MNFLVEHISVSAGLDSMTHRQLLLTRGYAAGCAQWLRRDYFTLFHKRKSGWRGVKNPSQDSLAYISIILQVNYLFRGRSKAGLRLSVLDKVMLMLFYPLIVFQSLLIVLLTATVPLTSC